jgi:hypothetical protein
MKDFVNNTLCDPVLVQMHNLYNGLWAADPKYPYFNYLGLNFDADRVKSIKFYFHVYRPLSTTEVREHIPGSDDFLRYYALHQHSMGQSLDNSGCALELKFHSDESSPSKGFHFRMRSDADTYRMLGMPRGIPRNLVLGSNMMPGINYEYGVRNMVKRYYYFSDLESKRHIAQMFDLDTLTRASLLEYAESEQFEKVNAYFEDTEALRSCLGTLPSLHQQLVHVLCERYDLECKAFGLYRVNGTRAVYMFSRQSSSMVAGVPCENRTCIDTIGNILNAKPWE